MSCSAPAPLFVRFSRKEYWSGLPCPSPGDLPSPGLPHCRWILYHHSSPPELPGKLISILTTSKSLTRCSVCHSDWHSYIQQPTWHIPCQLKLIMCKQNLLLSLHLTKQAKNLLLYLDSLSPWVCQVFIQVFESKSHILFLPPLSFTPSNLSRESDISTCKYLVHLLFIAAAANVFQTTAIDHPEYCNSLTGLPAFNIVSLFGPFRVIFIK